MKLIRRGPPTGNYTPPGASALPAARLACFVTALTLLSGPADARETERVPATPHALSLHVEVSGGSVTVRARNVILRDLLEEIGRQSDLILDLQDPLDGRATLEFDRLPLPEALDRILRRHNFALQHGDLVSAAGSSRKPRPGSLWVAFKGSDDDPTPPEDGDARRGRDRPSGNLEAEDPFVRLSLALSDDDSRVRLKAVSELASLGSDQAVAVLADASATASLP